MEKNGVFQLHHEGDGRPSFRVFNSSGSSVDVETTGLNVADGQWHHVVGTYDGSQGCLYADGEKVVCKDHPGPLANTTEPIEFADGAQNTDRYRGYLDNIKIYRRALTSQEVQKMYGGKEIREELVGEWRLNEGNGYTVYDTSGLNNGGILGSGSLSFQDYRESVEGDLKTENNFTVSTWVDIDEIGSRERPGNSCYDIKESNPDAVSGQYWVSPSEKKFKVYCDMERRGGGWTMLMKLKGQSSTFQYSSNYWENNQTLNTYSVEPEKNKDAKFASYHQLNISQIRAEFPGIGHNMNETLGTTTTAKNVFSSQKILGHENESGKVGDYGDFDKGEFAYQDGWQDYGFKLNGCNSRSKVRWGWIWNNEDDQCSSSDAGAGIGLTGEDLQDDIQTGSWSTCCSSTPTGNTERDGDGEGDFPRRAILWGREERPSESTENADIQQDGLYKLYITPDKIEAKLIGDSSNETIAYKDHVPDGFFHISLSYDGQKASLYIDGEKVKEKTVEQNLGTSQKFSVGNGYRGKMDEVRIYDRGLTEQEIQKLVFR